MCYFFRRQQTVERIYHKAEERPGWELPLTDTAMRRSAENEAWVNNREATIRRKYAGPNANANIGMLSMGVHKYDDPPDINAIIRWFRATFPATADAAAARSRDELEGMANRLFRQLAPEDQRRIVAGTADNTPPADSNNGQSMTAPVDALQAVQDQGRVTFKSDYKIPAGLFARTVAVQRQIKKNVGRTWYETQDGFVDLSLVFKGGVIVG